MLPLIKLPFTYILLRLVTSALFKDEVIVKITDSPILALMVFDLMLILSTAAGAEKSDSVFVQETKNISMANVADRKLFLMIFCI